MSKYYYEKGRKLGKRKILRLISLAIFLTGILMVFYIFLPLISWQIYFAPTFANQNVQTPIPKSTVVSSSTLQALIQNATESLSGVDFNNADNWFPTFKYAKSGNPKTQNYTISIPKLKIQNASVSTVDIDLTKHLVNYGGTAIPPERGNAVIFGHSTLPQLFDSKSYKTIFTYLFKLSPGDEIIVNIRNVTYKYRIENVTVVDPDNTTVLEQNYNDSYLTLVTCTPPGTIWKRLVLRAKIEDI